MPEGTPLRHILHRLALPPTIALAACTGERWPDPPTVAVEEFASDFHAWRDDRRTRLLAPGSGPLIWVGLWDLREGETRMGADSSLAISLTGPGAPRFAGTFVRTGQQVEFEPARGSTVVHVDSASSTRVTTRTPLANDRSEHPTVLGLGSIRMRVHGEPGTDRLWLRAWDMQHPARQTFQLPEAFALDLQWRVTARFLPFDSVRSFEVADIDEGTQVFRSPGHLAFRVNGREHQLLAFADTNSTTYFIMLWDSTANTTTYQAGRYVRAPLADSTGYTVIDFNRTYNPPCVFTAYSTCAFPPRENRLTFALTAGEKRVAGK